MAEDSSFSDRMIKRAVPAVVPAYAPDPEALGDGLFVLDRRLRHFGAALLPTRTTLVRLADGRLVVISPPPSLGDSGAAALDALGVVSHVVIPNTFHYLFANEFMERYPTARLLAPPGLGARVPEMAHAEELDGGAPDGWSNELEYAVVGPVRNASEVLFFHVPSGSLIVTDLAFNMTRYPRRVDRFIWRLSGVPARFGPGRTSRSQLLGDDEAVSRGLARAMNWPIRRIVVAHGEVVEEDAASRFREAFADHVDTSA